MKIFMVLMLFITANSYAAASLDESPNVVWKEGLQLTAGLGVNFSSFSSAETDQALGGGLALHSSVTYYLSNWFGLDLGMNVAFNRFDKNIIWSTHGSLGVRTKIPSIFPNPERNSYAKVFVGRGPSVIIFNGEKPEQVEAGESVDRVQFEGAFYGVSLGMMELSKSRRPWFAELSFILQSFDQLYLVDEVDEVAEIAETLNLDEKSLFYSISLVFGVALI